MKYPKGVLKREKNESDVLEIDESKMVKVNDFFSPPTPRTVGEFAFNSYYLSIDYDWVIVEDDKGYACLVPLEK